jgi:tetratricopeptide (TPR) repeat protein
MSADKVRRLLGSLLDDPENEKAWISLEERAISGELHELGEELPFMLAESRLMFAERGEAEAVLRVLDVEVELTPEPGAKARLLRERARVSEEELLDDRTALASVEALMGLGGHADASELKDRLTSKKARWKEILAAYKRHAENDTTDPTLIASHLASAAGIVFQYKGKGRDREADQLFESALSVDPGNLRAVQLYERVLRKRGDRWADLAALLERSAEAVTASDAKVNLMLRAARTYAGRLRQFADAERLYRKALSIDTGHVDATRFLAALLTEQGRVNDLIDFYEGQLRASPANARDVGLLALTGMAHWRMRHDPRSAEPHFRKILELAPDNPIAQSFFFEHQATVVEMSPMLEDSIGDDVEFDTSGMEEFSVDVDDGEAGATVEMPAAGITLDMLRAAQPAAPPAASGAVRIVRTHVLGGGEPVRSVAPAVTAPREVTDENATVVEAPAASSALLAAMIEKGKESAPVEPSASPEVEAPKPVAVEAPKPVVAEAPKPVAVETPKPVVAEAPTRSAVETAPLGDTPTTRSALDTTPLRDDDAMSALETAPLTVPSPPRSAVETAPLGPTRSATDTAPLTEPAPTRAADPPVRPSSTQTAAVVAPAAPRPVAAPAAAKPATAARGVQALEAAHAAEASGQTDKAIDAWKLVLRQEPTNAEARVALGRLYTAAGRWANLVELHRQEIDSLGGVRTGADGVITHRERKLELLREMAEVYQDRLGQEPMVVQTYNSILAIEPGDRAALVALAASYEKLGRHTDVVKVLDQQAEHSADPSERVTLYRKIAWIWLDRFNNVNNATKPLEQILAIDPRDADAIAQLKDLYGRRRAWRQLFEVSRREADMLDGTRRRDAVVELARLAAEKLSSPVESIALWREALELDRNTPGALDALEKLTEREKDYAGLADVLERRAEEAGDADAKVSVLMKLGAVYGERLNDPARSIDAWRRVLAVKPGHPKAMRVLRDAYTAAGEWDTLEELYASAGDFEGLADVLNASAERADGDAAKVALSFRAAKVLEERLGQPTRAFRAYERVLAVEPKNLRAASALVPIYLDEEKWQRLGQLYEVLLDAVPTDDSTERLAYLHKLRELAATRLNDRPAAFRWALRAYQIRPDDADLERTLEQSAADAGAWRELVETLDARAAAVADPAEAARLRDKAAEVEADRLNLIDKAIGRYQSALAEAPDDAAIVTTLDRLLRRAGRWSDLRALFDHRVARVSDGADRRALLVEAARMEETQLSDADAASARYRRILEADPADAESLEALSRLSEGAGRWEELSGLLAQRRDAASGSERAELAFRLGELKAKRLGDTGGAIESFREVLALEAHHPGALRALEGLLDDGAWKVTAARILEPEYEATHAHVGLARVLRILLDATEDAAERRSLGLRLARVHGERLEESRAAFTLLQQLLGEQPDSDDFADTLAEFATVGGWNRELAETLASIVDRPGLDPAVRVQLARRAAAVYDDRHGDPDSAERFHRIVLDSGVEDAHAFPALKRFYQERERWDDLRALYATWVDRTPDVRARVELLQEEAVMLEEVLEKPSEAAAVYRRVLDLDENNVEAFRSLDRLYTRLGRWSDLATIFTHGLDRTGDIELLFRRGEVREKQLGDAEGALADYEHVVDREAAHVGARAGLERLVSNPALRLRAAAVLEPLYQADGDKSAGDLVRMMVVRLEGTADPSARAELYRRVAELRELVLDDAPGAFDAVREATLAEPASESIRAELLRLSAMASRDDAAAEALEKAAADERAASVRVPLLQDLASLYDERLSDHERAKSTYRRLLDVAGDDTEVTLQAAVALERLYTGLGDARGLVDALELRAKHESDPSLRRTLYSQAGQIREDDLRDLPGAITAQRARLDIDPTDREALGALARLYQNTEAWSALVATLRRDAELADTATEQKALQVRAARVLEGRLGDLPAAIGLYTDVLASYGPDREIHAALAKLYEVSDRWADLLGVLEQDLAVATESADRLALIVRIAELRRLRTGELPSAVDGYKDALELDASQPVARAALEALLSEREPGVGLAAARALDPVLQAEQSWEKLVGVLERIAADTDDPEERRRSLARASDVCEIGMNDPGRAFGYASRELRESLAEPDVARRIDQVEALARASGRHADLAAALKDAAPELLDPELQISVLMKVAELSRRHLDDRTSARAYYEKALDQRPDHEPALDALETLHEEGKEHVELLAVLRRKTDLAVTDEARRALLRKQAGVSERELNDRPAAAQAHEAIMAMGFDRDAATALERIYAAEARWRDLSDLLESQLALADADGADLHFRLGRVSMDHLADADRALDHFREVLDQAPDHGPTVEALEALGGREGYGARTAAMLEPIYLARGDNPKLIGALEARIAAEDDVVARKELLTRLGMLYEEGLGDLDHALKTYARVFREELGDRDTWATMARIAARLGRWDRLAEIYAAALEETTSDDEVTAELSFQTARLFDERVGDTARARTYYRRALAFDPSRDEVFAAIEALLTRENAHRELLALYREAADRADDVEARKGYLFKIAAIDESALNDAPRAIADYREILEVDPADVRAVTALDALLARTEQWTDLAELLEKRIADAVSSDERCNLRYRLGRLRVERLRDPQGGVDAFREILDERRDRRDAVSALEQIADHRPELRLQVVETLEPLYRETDDWRKLVAVLGVRLAATTDRVDRAQLLREIGAIKDTRARDIEGAFAAYSQAFAGDAGDGEAREAVERLAAEHTLWDKLVMTYETALAATDDVATKTDLLRAVAQTHDQHRDDPRAAIDAYNRLFTLDDSQLDVLDLLENLHVLLSDWSGHVEVLERKVARTLDDEDRKRLLHTIGDSQRDMLGNPALAISAFRRALDIDPADVFALEALDGLYTSAGDAAELAGVLSQRLSIEGDAEVRRETALRLGRLWETDLRDPQQAIDAYRRCLDDAPTDRTAILALEQLYQQQSLWSDLQENLRAQVAFAEDDRTRAPLLLRLGNLLATHLGDPDGALETWREVLSVDPSSEQAIASVRALADNADQRAAAVEILEPIFRNAARWSDLVSVLELKIAGIDDPASRLTELRGLAEVHESGRRDPASAFEAYRRALHEGADDRSIRDELERLAAPLNRWPELVSVFEAEAADANDPTVGRDLSVRAAELAAHHLGDSARATRSYRKALDIAGDDDAVLEPLDAIYVQTGEWTELVEVLERRVSIAGDPQLLDYLEVRIGDARERHFHDPAGALPAYRNVVERTPSHPQALAGLERLLAAPAVRADVIDVLEQAYQRVDDNPKLAWLLGLRVEAADLSTDKVRLLGDLARLREDRLGDLSGAFDASVLAFRLDPRDESVLAEVERLAPSAGAWSRLVGVMEDVLAQHGDLAPTESAALNLRAAGWYQNHIGDARRAEERLVAALAAEPESGEALEMLEGLQRAPGRVRDLVATLRRRAELELDSEARKGMLREASEIAEVRLGDVDAAAELVSSLLDTDDADVVALDTLARLRTAQGRHEEVADLLARRARLTDDPAEATSMRRRVAELYAGPIADADRAVQAYRELLDFEPNDGPAREALERIYEGAGRWRDLEEALRGRLDVAVSTEERAATRLRLAKLAEVRFQSNRDAVEYLREVIDETPTHVEAGRELERLYTTERRWADLGELLERRADDCAAEGDGAGELAALVRIGELNERELKNVSRAVELYERVLERDPEHAGALAALARLAEADGQWERAVEMLNRSLDRSPPGAASAEAALHVAAILGQRLNDEPGMERALHRALAFDETCRGALEQIKGLALKRGDSLTLAAVMEREVPLLADAKAKVAQYRSLAEIARDKLRDPGRAAAYMEQASALAPEDREILGALVDLYNESGRQSDAVPILERIIASYGTRRSKDLAQWQHRLGRAFEAMGDTAAALTQYDAAFKIDLTSAPILRDLGLLCLKTGDLERAQKTFRALLLQRLDASAGITKADVYYYLGETLSRQNDAPKAIGMLERALENDKTHAHAAALLARLKGG